MAGLKYKDEKSLASIDGLFKLANEVLGSDSVIIKGKKSIPLSVGFALAGTISAGIGTVGTGVGTASLVGGTASLAGGAATAIGGAVLLPFAAPIALIGGIGYLLFKNKKDKELQNKKLARYNEAIKKQNDIIKKYRELDKQRVETECKENTIKVEIRAKINELLTINEVLLTIIEQLGSDLKVA